MKKNKILVLFLILVLLLSVNAETANIDWSKVSAHELGHAFGYNGHYGGGDVMHIYYHGIIDSTPASNELDHLGQVY